MDLREIQLIQLDVLKIFLDIINKHKLSYFILGGTLLGAVRHKGFIPWDDDIDVGMPRPDYEKFLEICKTELPQNYGIKTFMNSTNFIKYHTKLENYDYIFVSNSYQTSQKMYLWIDIFPLDGMPNSNFKLLFHKFHLLYLRAMSQLSQFDQTIDLTNKKRPWYEKGIIFFGKYFKFGRKCDPKEIMYKLDKCLKKYPYETSDYLINFMGAYKFNEMFHKSIYGNGKIYQFESLELVGPENYDYVLSQLYGDYLIPPTVSDRNRHGLQIIDSKNNYEIKC